MLCCTVGWEWMASLCGCVMGCQMSQLMMRRTSHLDVWTILSHTCTHCTDSWSQIMYTQSHDFIKSMSGHCPQV